MATVPAFNASPFTPTYTQPQLPIFGNQAAFQPTIQPIQQTAPVAASGGLVGRFVASADEITPQEVSMTSTPSLFPLADGTAIIAKQWSNDGTIKTVRYSAEVDEVRDTAPTVSLMDIANQINDMQDTLDALQKAMEKKPATTKRTSKKEADDAED